MNKISLKTFLFHFCKNIRADKKFCFILGAGASKPSGIPTGSELVVRWMEELKDIYEPGEVKLWMKEEKISSSDLPGNYSKIYDKRFELDKKEGFAFLEKLMEGVEPSCGYSVLAQILDQKPHKIVITTNFDSLSEDALFIYTRKKPLVVVHESLADYIKPFGSRPIIVKIHRDLFFSPKNSPEHTSALENSFVPNLEAIFRYYTPLVIGYGGNDGSLMGFLEALDTIEGGIFWFYREADGEPNLRIQNLISKFHGYGIPIKGFDELMIQLGNELKFEHLDKKVLEIADQRVKTYRDQIERVNQSVTGDIETKSALSGMLSRSPKDWWYYILSARAETEPDKQENIYLEGMKNLPKSPELLISYATFLHGTRKDYDRAEELYKKAIELDPKQANYLGNYAIFLADVRKDYDRAEELYQKAIELDPKHAINLGNYANFLADVRKDYDRAEDLYKKAIELDPNSANNLGNYAKLLIVRGTQTSLSKAKEFILKAFSLNKAGSELEEVLSLELWFYCFAIFPAEFADSKKNIEALLSKGVRSPGWNLKDVLQVAKKMAHPEYDKLCEFEKTITMF